MLLPCVGDMMLSSNFITWKASCDGGVCSCCRALYCCIDDDQRNRMLMPQDTFRLRSLGSKWLLRATAAWRGGNLSRREKAILLDEIKALKAKFLAILPKEG